MTALPIIFSGPMVRALMEGRKTQTRRVLKPDPDTLANGFAGLRIPYAPSDRLYVREAFSYDSLDEDRDGTRPIWFWADGNPDWGNWTRPKPSIHMPRWASRLTLTVTEVRVQRLQEISAEDVEAEGYPGPSQPPDGPYLKWYSDLWNSLHGPDAWTANPWVVAISFTVDRRNIDEGRP